MRDWTPLPLPTHDQVEQAAVDLLRVAEIEGLQRGGVTFRRDDLTLVGWSDPKATLDWDDSLDEIGVELDRIYVDDDDVADREFTYGQNLARCRLEIRHAIERRDQSLVLMGEAIEENHR